jgi:hypothetical protein
MSTIGMSTSCGGADPSTSDPNSSTSWGKF